MPRDPLIDKILQTIHIHRSLGTEIKARETLKTWKLPADQPFVVRLDGVAFARATRLLKKPFDERLSAAFVQTAGDVLLRFPATTAFTQSDEISLLFPRQPLTPNATPPAHLYGGRVQKMVSVLAAYASVRLCEHLRKDQTINMPVDTVHLDARVVPCEQETQAMEALFWRAAVDGPRNAISAAAQSLFPHHQLQGKTSADKVDLLAGKGICLLTDYPPAFLFGVFIKRRHIKVTKEHPLTKQILPNVQRTVLVHGSFPWDNHTEQQRIAFATAKFWDIHSEFPCCSLRFPNGNQL